MFIVFGYQLLNPFKILFTYGRFKVILHDAKVNLRIARKRKAEHLCLYSISFVQDKSELLLVYGGRSEHGSIHAFQEPLRGCFSPLQSRRISPWVSAGAAHRRLRPL